MFPQAQAQHEADEGFWLRGLMPFDRVQVPAPSHEEYWWDNGFSEGVFEGCLGPGTAARPRFAFGDASGGPDSASSLFRRIGIGLAICGDAINMSIERTVSGSLPGSQQSVPRGELFMFMCFLRWATDFCIYVTDNKAVFDGWHQ